MGKIELWLGAAGSGKTSCAMALLHEQMALDWRAVRYIVPTVGHKRKIEEMLLATGPAEVLFADPVNIFFTFAQQVAQRGGIAGSPISEMQKYLLLKRLIQQTPLDHFSRAAQFPGFVQALGEIIDELKVQMIAPEILLKASAEAAELGAVSMSKKLAELGGLYNSYQQFLITEQLFDNEGIMWLAAECLREQSDVLNEIQCLILDGFARMTPIQLYFLRALAPRIERIIVLFDFEEGRSIPYHPVQTSLDRIFLLQEQDQVPIIIRSFNSSSPTKSSLQLLRQELYRERKSIELDATVCLFAAATPEQEIEMIAREIHKLLHAGKLADGTPIGAGDIAILARDAEQIRARFAHTFSYYGLPMKSATIPLAQTIVGRVLLAIFRILRDGWKREDVLMLMRSGFLPIASTMVARIDVIARTNALREGKESWSDLWPDEESAPALTAALKPIFNLDELYQRLDPQDKLLTGIMRFISEIHNRLLDSPAQDSFPWPNIQSAEAERLQDLQAAFTQSSELLADLQRLDLMIGGFSETELIDIISTALLRQKVKIPVAVKNEIALLPVQSTAGEKYKVVFVCQMQQGSFPRRQRESTFLMDHEREETLKEMDIIIDSRKQLEDDEYFWFLHALSASSQQIILSYAQYDNNGSPLEPSEFLEEVNKILPDLPAQARRGDFGEVAPPYDEAAHSNEYLARLLCDLRLQRDEEEQKKTAAAHLACTDAHGIDSPLARAFTFALRDNAGLFDQQVLQQIAQGRQLYSASQLQSFADCPFLWFARSCLGIQSLQEDFSFLDRGSLLHEVLEKFYSSLAKKSDGPVHLENYQYDDLWEIMEEKLTNSISRVPRYYNRSQVIRDLELHQLQRQLKRFLRIEIERATQRKLHPAFFERKFNDNQSGTLLLGDGVAEIHGIIDRIDISDENSRQAIVADYKSSLQMTLKSLEAGELMQPPIYALALQRRLGYEALGVEYINLKNGKTLGIYQESFQGVADSKSGAKILVKEQWEKWLQEGEAGIVDLVKHLREGDISLSPNCRSCPDDCDFFPLCRGNRFRMQQAVRAAKAAKKNMDE